MRAPSAVGRCRSSRGNSGFSVLEITVAIGILSIAIVSLGGLIVPLNQQQKLLDENSRAAEIAHIMLERIQGAAWFRLGEDPWSWHRREQAELFTNTVYVDQFTGTDNEEFKHRPLVDDPSGGALGDWLSENNFTFSDLVDDGDASALADEFGLPYVVAGQVNQFGEVSANAAPPISVPAEIQAQYNTPLRYNSLQFLGILNEPSGLENLRVYLEYFDEEVFVETMGSRASWNTMVIREPTAGNMVSLPQREDFLLPQSHRLLDLEVLADKDREAIVVRILITWDRRNGGVGRHEVVTARRR